MSNKALKRNIVPATALTASTTISQTEQAQFGRGVRLWITVAAATAAGGVDSVSLCGVPPAGGTAVPIAGFSAANALSVAGTYMADFYPGAWLPATVAAGNKLLGAAGICLPVQWAVQIVIGAGNAATITVDAEMLP